MSSLDFRSADRKKYFCPSFNKTNMQLLQRILFTSWHVMLNLMHNQTPTNPKSTNPKPKPNLSNHPTINLQIVDGTYMSRMRSYYS